MDEASMEKLICMIEIKGRVRRGPVDEQMCSKIGQTARGDKWRWKKKPY